MKNEALVNKILICLNFIQDMYTKCSLAYSESSLTCSLLVRFQDEVDPDHRNLGGMGTICSETNTAAFLGQSLLSGSAGNAVTQGHNHSSGIRLRRRRRGAGSGPNVRVHQAAGFSRRSHFGAPEDRPGPLTHANMSPSHTPHAGCLGTHTSTAQEGSLAESRSLEPKDSDSANGPSCSEEGAFQDRSGRLEQLLPAAGISLQQNQGPIEPLGSPAPQPLTLDSCSRRNQKQEADASRSSCALPLPRVWC